MVRTEREDEQQFMETIIHDLYSMTKNFSTRGDRMAVLGYVAQDMIGTLTGSIQISPSDPKIFFMGEKAHEVEARQVWSIVMERIVEHCANGSDGVNIAQLNWITLRVLEAVFTQIKEVIIQNRVQNFLIVSI